MDWTLLVTEDMLGLMDSLHYARRNADCIHLSATQVSAMPHTSSITYLPLPSWLEASVEEARSATSNTVISDSQRWAFEFELPVNESVKCVVDEVKKVYLVCSNTPQKYR
ncbi:hypothetical protein BDBG_08873 [Blastomyces gilchristii SLH14081]|uniref:Uncharacterized protein n=1 Tax=Blastomyces gilchristii (strain SLH14081) TaxID=559298 RepID=A0A179V063_BLAGS|nr:uncharacterized protein BDBG_08873 [Blastomyces gilchristii SLH14081]OAT13734.1 hypothetical protein BDBG_08873 [Blastomyces gilchristii SLH14081]